MELSGNLIPTMTVMAYFVGTPGQPRDRDLDTGRGLHGLISNTGYRMRFPESRTRQRSSGRVIELVDPACQPALVMSTIKPPSVGTLY
jgi:hypothetical protein